MIFNIGSILLNKINEIGTSNLKKFYFQYYKIKIKMLYYIICKCMSQKYQVEQKLFHLSGFPVISCVGAKCLFIYNDNYKTSIKFFGYLIKILFTCC